MGKSSRPRKPYRPRQAQPHLPGRLQPWVLDKLFAPLESMLQHIRDGGDLEVDEDEQFWYYSTTMGGSFKCAELLESFGDIFARQRQRDTNAPDPEALYVMAASMTAEILAMREVEAAIACASEMRGYMGASSLGNMKDAVLLASLDSHMTTVYGQGDA